MFGYKIARIDGRSMEPMLPDGSFALFRRAKTVEQGDVILVNHPEFGLIVKQASFIADDGRVALQGTSSHSTRPERLGRVDKSLVLGKMIARLPRISGDT